MKQFFLILLVILCVSCSTTRLQFKENSIYYILNDNVTASPEYDLYFERDDILKCAEIYSNNNIENDWINQVTSVFTSTTKVFCNDYVVKSNDEVYQIQQVIDLRWVLLEFAYDLFKEKKVIVYDRNSKCIIPYKFINMSPAKDYVSAFVKTKSGKTIFYTPVFKRLY